MVFLFGGTSVGKSPVTWNMAHAISRGISFFGLPTRQARVLYIDVDSPEQVAAARLRLIRDAHPNFWLYFTQPISIPQPTPEEVVELKAAREIVKPEVVFINTLRKVHDLDDKDSKTPKVVYSWWQHFFPNTALVFVHHPRKANTQQGGGDIAKRETFSGSMAWLNDAQVGLMLQKSKALSTPHWNGLRLYHVKSQATGLSRSLPLHLSKEDGVSLECPMFKELLTAYEVFHEHDGKQKGKIDAEVAQRLGVSEITARRRRMQIENGDFPNSARWLGRDDETGEDEDA